MEGGIMMEIIEILLLIDWDRESAVAALCLG